MNLKKTKKAVAFLCAVALIGSTSYQMVGNSLSVSASTESTVSNFNVVSEDTFDWNNWDFGESIPSSEKMNFGEDEELWGENIVYNNDFSLVTEEESDDGSEKIYQWNVPATEIKFLGGMTGKDAPENAFASHYFSQQMLFGKKIENAFTVKLHIFSDRIVSGVELIPNQELNNDDDVKGYVLPDGMDIKFNKNSFNYGVFYDQDLINNITGFNFSKTYITEAGEVQYSLPRVISSNLLSRQDGTFIDLNLTINENAYENEVISVFGKSFRLNGERSASEATRGGRTFSCSFSDDEDEWYTSPSFGDKNYDVSVTLDAHTGEATFDFCFNQEQDDFFKMQEFMYNKVNQFTETDTEAFSIIEDYKRYLKDMYTIELSTKSKEIADNIVTAIKTDYDGFYTDCGYRYGDWDFKEKNLSLTEYEHQGETYYRIEYCFIDDDDFSELSFLNEKVLFELSNVTLKLPFSKLVDSTGGDSTMLIGVPYDFYEDNDYYGKTLDNNIVDFKEVLSQLEIEVETGDVDGNGVVNSLDLMRLKKYILGVGNPLTVFNKYGADVNDDGNINVLDIIALKKILLTK